MSDYFSLDRLQQQAEAAPPGASLPPPPPSPAPAPDAAPASPAAPTATPAPPAAADASASQYVDLDHWRPGPDPSAPDTAHAADDAKWEARYHALKGKYDAEVPRLSEELRALKAQLGQNGGTDGHAELQLLRDLTRRQAHELETLKQQAPAALARTTAGEDDLDALSDDDLAFEFGENGAKAIRSLLTRVDGLQQRVAEQVKPLETRLAQSEAQGFRERLAQRLGDAQSVFQHADWPGFVFQSIPFGGGKTFNQALQEADARHDIDAIVEIVQAFRQRGALPPAAVAAAGASAGASALDALAVPDRIHAGSAPTAGQRFRSGDMETVMGQWQRGQRTFQELQQFERAFNQALREGRVDP